MCTYLIQVKCVAGHYVNEQILGCVSAVINTKQLELDGMNPNLSAPRHVLFKVVPEPVNILENRKCFDKIFQNLTSLYKKMLSPIKITL